MTILPLRNSVNHAPSRRGFLLIPLALAVALLALPHSAKAADGAVGDGTSTAEGTNALKSLATGTDDTACGFNALASNTSGNENTATGAFALTSNDGSFNTAAGFNALGSNTSGADNTATGAFALVHNTTGNDNTATGLNALFFNMVPQYQRSNCTYFMLNSTAVGPPHPGIANYNDVKVGDQIEAFSSEKVATQLNP